jgi:peptidyl-prolyl cis-trans isomerase C
MTTKSCYALLLAISFFLPCSVGAAEDRVLATIGDETITVGDLDDRISIQAESYKKRFAGSQEARRGLLEEMVKNKTLARAAREQGLDRDADTRLKIQMETERILAEAFTSRVYAGVTVTDEDVAAFYEKYKNKKEYKKEFMLPAKVHLLHISVKKMEEAERIRKQLERGADFSKLARKHSIHKFSANKGGDLGWLEKKMIRNLGRDIARAAEQLPVGSVSKPLKYGSAYHLIKVAGRKPAELRPLEEMKTEIRIMVLRTRQRKAMKAAMRDLEETLPVRIMDEPGGEVKRKGKEKQRDGKTMSREAEISNF